MFGKILDGLPVDSGCPFVGFDLGKCLKQSLLIQHAVIETVVNLRHTCSCVSFSLPCSSRLRSWPGSHRLLSQRAIYDNLSRLLQMDDHYPQRVSYNRPQIACPAPSDGLCPAQRSRDGSENLRINFLPSHSAAAFGSQRTPSTKRQVVPVLPSRLLPAFTGRDFITTTDSSATSHRVVRPRVAPCASLIQYPTTQTLKQCKASPVTSDSL